MLASRCERRSVPLLPCASFFCFCQRAVMLCNRDVAVLHVGIGRAGSEFQKFGCAIPVMPRLRPITPFLPCSIVRHQFPPSHEKRLPADLELPLRPHVGCSYQLPRNATSGPRGSSAR